MIIGRRNMKLLNVLFLHLRRLLLVLITRSFIVDVSLGGRNDIKVISGSTSGGATTLRFRRALNTGDQYDTPIKASGTTDLVYAWRVGTPGEVTIE